MSLTPAMRSGGRRGGSTPTARPMTSALSPASGGEPACPCAPKGHRVGSQQGGHGSTPSFLGICLLTLPRHQDSQEPLGQTPHLGAWGPGAAGRRSSQLPWGWGQEGPSLGISLPPSLHVSLRVERREWSRLKAKVSGEGRELWWKSGGGGQGCGARGSGLLTNHMACSVSLGLGLQLWITG